VTGAVLGLGYVNASDAAAQLSDPAGQFWSIRDMALPVYDPRKLRPRGGWRADLFPIAWYPSLARPMTSLPSSL
jgi:hypothetical protein